MFSKFYQIFCTLPASVARSSIDDSEIRYVLPVLWMTSCFHITEQTGRIRDDAYKFHRVREVVAGIGDGDEVFRLRLHLIWLRLHGPLTVLCYTTADADTGA